MEKHYTDYKGREFPGTFIVSLDSHLEAAYEDMNGDRIGYVPNSDENLTPQPEDDDEGCPGHESLAGAHMGEVVFCDGTCTDEPYGARDFQRDVGF